MVLEFNGSLPDPSPESDPTPSPDPSPVPDPKPQPGPAGPPPLPGVIPPRPPPAGNDRDSARSRAPMQALEAIDVPRRLEDPD
jgi:hypothetical protein